MCRREVTIQDAIVAVTCVECSMQNTALLGSTNALHTKFPDDPEEEFKAQAELILKRLKLNDLFETLTSNNDKEHNENVAESRDRSVGGTQSCESEGELQNGVQHEDIPSPLVQAFDLDNRTDLVDSNTIVSCSENRIGEEGCNTLSDSENQERRTLASHLHTSNEDNITGIHPAENPFSKSRQNDHTRQTTTTSLKQNKSLKNTESKSSYNDNLISLFQKSAPTPQTQSQNTTQSSNKSAGQLSNMATTSQRRSTPRTCIFTTDDISEDDLELEWPPGDFLSKIPPKGNHHQPDDISQRTKRFSSNDKEPCTKKKRDD